MTGKKQALVGGRRRKAQLSHKTDESCDASRNEKSKWSQITRVTSEILGKEDDHLEFGI